MIRDTETLLCFASYVASYVEMDLDHHSGVCALLPSLLSYSVSVVVSTLDRQSGDLGLIHSSCTSAVVEIRFSGSLGWEL